MAYITGIWIVWAVLALLLLILLGYRATITRNEEDLLFLEGGNELREHEQMMARVQRLRPAIRVVGGVTGLATITLVGLYLMDALRQF
jgi:uncharacterized membrane protein YecN with MAPEG domain